MRASSIRWAMLVSAALSCGCAAVVTPSPTAPSAPDVPRPAEPAQIAKTTSAREPGWRYDVVVSPDAGELRVTAVIDAGWSAALSVERGAEPFLREVEIEQGGQWLPVASDGITWTAEACEAQGCRLRYRVMLGAIAAAVADLDVAQRFDGVVVSTPSAWLLHPLHTVKSGKLEITLHAADDLRVAFGLRQAPAQRSDARAYVGDVLALPDAPYAALGQLETYSVPLEGGALEVAIAGSRSALQRERMRRWINRAAQAVTRYWGRFPMERAVLVVVPVEGKGVGFGRTLGGGGASIVIGLGRVFEERDLDDDWVLVHELIHLALPSLPTEQRWLEEGLSTYVEPLVRHQAGLIDEQTFWRAMIESMPLGLAQEGEGGLDGTTRWGRIYWGGALYWLLVDIEIRSRTGDARSLRDVLRAVVNAGGDASKRWSLSKLIEVADLPSAGAVRALYQALGQRGERTHLEALWRGLGVRIEKARVVFDDRAPRAGTRRALLSP